LQELGSKDLGRGERGRRNQFSFLDVSAMVISTQVLSILIRWVEVPWEKNLLDVSHFFPLARIKETSSFNFKDQG
jgi:hypothetical protein